MNIKKIRSPPAFHILQTSSTKESEDLSAGGYCKKNLFHFQRAHSQSMIKVEIGQVFSCWSNVSRMLVN